MKLRIAKKIYISANGKECCKRRYSLLQVTMAAIKVATRGLKLINSNSKSRIIGHKKNILQPMKCTGCQQEAWCACFYYRLKCVER